MTLTQAISAIASPSAQAMVAVQHRFANIAIPLGSMGQMQSVISQLACIMGTTTPQIQRRAVVVFCADNGVVAQGVTQCGQEVTATVTENLSKDMTTVCLMSKHIGATVIPVDIGVSRDVGGAKLRHHKIAYGTNDMTQGPAMTREQCVQALEVGIALAEACKQEGYQLVAAGEMGIGNTTTSAAMAALLLNEPVESMTGRGAGLSSEGLARKIVAIAKAIAINQPNANDPLDILAKLGGYDIAGMCGFYLGCAAVGLPCLLDGIISNVAALTAVRMAPACNDYLIASHMTAEPAGQKLLAALGKQAIISANMRLGEGTGAVAAMSLIDIMLAPYNAMPCFDEIQIDAYQQLT